jgi:copper chaperone
MTTFHVPDMSCGHCTRAIEKAIGEADSAASVTCDLDAHLVNIQSALPAETLAATLNHAGYPAILAI